MFWLLCGLRETSKKANNNKLYILARPTPPASGVFSMTEEEEVKSGLKKRTGHIVMAEKQRKRNRKDEKGMRGHKMGTNSAIVVHQHSGPFTSQGGTQRIQETRPQQTERSKKQNANIFLRGEGGGGGWWWKLNYYDPSPKVVPIFWISSGCFLIFELKFWRLAEGFCHFRLQNQILRQNLCI